MAQPRTCRRADCCCGGRWVLPGTAGYRKNDLVLLDVKINSEPVDPLAAIVHRDQAYYVSLVCFRAGRGLPAAVWLGGRGTGNPDWC